MQTLLKGKRIVFIATDGVEQMELTWPWQLFQRAGAKVELVSLQPGGIIGYHGRDRGDAFAVNKTVLEASADDYDMLVLPGGVANSDTLRCNVGAVGLVRAFSAKTKPVAAISHGPWLLVEADLVRGRTLTSWPSLRTDISNAGGYWVDQDICVDQDLITCRTSDSLPALCNCAMQAFTTGPASRHEPTEPLSETG